MRTLSAIARVTFFEIIRDKVLYNVLVVACLLFGAGYLASQLSQFLQDRILLDFGVAAVTISSSAIGLLAGSSLLTREYDRKTYMVALSRPIQSTTFVSGKFLGLASVLFLNTALLGALLAAMLSLSTQTLNSATIFWAVVFAWIQSLMLAGAAILISSYSTTSIAVMIGFALYLIGVNLSSLSVLARKNQGLPIEWLFQVLSLILPNFEFFSLGTKVTYGIDLTPRLVATAIVYGLGWTAIMVLAAGMLIRRRDR